VWICGGQSDSGTSLSPSTSFPLPVYLSVHHAPYLPVIRNWCSRDICGCSTKGLVFITLLQLKTEQHSSSVCSKTFLTNKGWFYFHVIICIKTEPISKLLMWISKIKLSKYVTIFWSGPWVDVTIPASCSITIKLPLSTPRRHTGGVEM